VVGVEYEGNVRRGLVGVCLGDGAEHRASLADLAFRRDSEIGRLIGAYLFCMDCNPWPAETQPPPAGDEAAWRYPGHTRSTDPAADVPAIEQPLRLRPFAPWDPADAWPADPDEPVPSCLEPILAAGPRPAFELEQVLPGEDPETMHDPIGEAVDRGGAGDRDGARRLLRSLIAHDARCIDAHGHLGWLAFEYSAKRALPHYQAGVAIAERSLPSTFSGVLPWGLVDNRPFLRCLHGLGLCHWRLGRYEEAASVFHSLLWLNPADNQGARELIELVDGRMPWRSGGP